MSKKTILLTAISLLLSVHLWAANKKTTVEQVTSTITVTEEEDYIITSDTPFGDEGIVNIENKEHAVLILKDVKPSKAKRLLAAHVQIGGEKAVDGTNCQLKLYNRGSIIMPYNKDLKPLTVYSEPNFEGEACSDFGFESESGFMNTLTNAKLNNRIRSFRLKRGHMVTFAIGKGGRGYSRCFIAADQDLELATLPAILDRSISSYRVFKWYDAGKPQLAAAGGDTGACSALNVTSTYSWNQGTNMLPDQECVSHHIYEDYPSASTCGNVSYTCHMKTNNEPRNSSDDTPQDLETILNNWENLMRTGMRLCSPSSWDGSDYWNGTGFLKQFFDSIDARGWRCDILDMHCYWPESNFNNLSNWVNAVHRPIWISEWCWGASWNTNGAFANGVTENQVRDALKRICNNLNSKDYVERYFYWNGERDPSKLYKSGKLTPAGEMYAQLDGGLAYNGKYDYVPKAPKQKDPKDLTVYFDRSTGTADISWYEYNHEMNEYIHVECRKGSNQQWEVVRDVTGIEMEGIHLIKGLEASQGWEFRISEKDANGKVRTSKTVIAASGNIQAGDAIDIDGKNMYLGGNLLLNGNFELGLNYWQDGTGQPIAQPWFQAVPVGGSSDNGAYLQCYGVGNPDTEQAVKMVIDVEPSTDYYLTADIANSSGLSCTLAFSTDGQYNDSTVAAIGNSESVWRTLYQAVNSGRFGKVILRLRTLQNKAQFDNIQLCRLFATQEEGLADGFSCELKRAQAVIDTYNNDNSAIKHRSLLKRCIEEAKGYDDTRAAVEFLKESTDNILASIKLRDKLWELKDQANLVLYQYYLPGHERLEEAIVNALKPFYLESYKLESSDEIILLYNELKEAMDDFLDLTTLTDKIDTPDFGNFNDYGKWQVKTGTYQGGEQGLGLWSGNDVKWYWNALWNIPKEGNEQQTMAIRQEVTGLDHGLYAIECEATTDHYCMSDQHAYIKNGKDSIATPLLTADYKDLPGAADYNHWETLTSAPVYVEDGGSITIGFEGSKKNATDLAWREVGKKDSKGDYREGSWAATGFRLRYHPAYRADIDGSRWGVCCLPYAVSSYPFIKYYQIAAITSDYKTLCLEEIAETTPGVPFIFHADLNTKINDDGKTAFLPGFGESVDKATDGPGNLRGFFKTTGRVPVGYYVLGNGKWTKVTDSSNRPRISNYTGIMRPLNDKLSNPIAVVDSWNGPTLPIEGITDEEIANGISDILLPNNDKDIYDLQGRRLNGKPKQKGIYIREGRKVIQ